MAKKKPKPDKGTHRLKFAFYKAGTPMNIRGTDRGPDGNVEVAVDEAQKPLKVDWKARALDAEMRAESLARSVRDWADRHQRQRQTLEVQDYLVDIFEIAHPNLCEAIRRHAQAVVTRHDTNRLRDHFAEGLIEKGARVAAGTPKVSPDPLSFAEAEMARDAKGSDVNLRLGGLPPGTETVRIYRSGPGGGKGTKVAEVRLGKRAPKKKGK